MYRIIVALAFVIITIVIFVKKFIKVENMKKFKFIMGGAIKGIFSNKAVVRPANIPLDPFISPLKINKPPAAIPKFLLYKKKYLSPIWDQGTCGSCWAFSISSMLSDRLSLLTQGRFNKMLSTQQILECYNPKESCTGASPEKALMFLDKRRYKLKLNDTYPYKQKDETSVTGLCVRSRLGISIKLNSVKRLTEWIEDINPDPKILKENILNMKLELLRHGPIIAAMAVYYDLYTYNGLGIYKHDPSSKFIGGHAIEIVGYCDPLVDKRKSLIGVSEGYWICRNCWGLDWPIQTQNGYFMIKMGTNECGIESRCCVAIPDTATDTLPGNVKYTSIERFLSASSSKNSYI